MRIERLETERRHDHAPDTDDIWAWIIIGLVAAGVMLAVAVEDDVADLVSGRLVLSRGWPCTKGCLVSVSGA
jgi:hypothetical protein